MALFSPEAHVCRSIVQECQIEAVHDIFMMMIIILSSHVFFDISSTRCLDHPGNTSIHGRFWCSVYTYLQLLGQVQGPKQDV